MLIVIIKNRLTLVLGKKQTDNIFFKIYPYAAYRASLIAQSVKNLPAMQETLVRFLGQEDPLEKEMANGNPFQYSCLENPMDRGVPGRPQSKESTVHGVARAGHDLATKPPPGSLQKIYLESVRIQESLT